MTLHYATPDGRITLHHGDSLHTLATLETASVDAVITDPPYSSGGMVRSDRTQTVKDKYVGSEQNRNGTGGAALADFTGDSRDQRSFAYWSTLWLGEALRVTKPGGILIIFADWRQLPVTSDALQAGGWVWRGIVPWIKTTARPQLGRFRNQCEYALWASNGVLPLKGKCYPGFYQAGPPRDREHITQKPLDVMRALTQIVPEGGLVLDPFMGAGTTGVAAILEGRRFIGCEMVERYVEISQRRIMSAVSDIDTAQPALDLEIR